MVTQNSKWPPMLKINFEENQNGRQLIKFKRLSWTEIVMNFFDTILQNQTKTISGVLDSWICSQYHIKVLRNSQNPGLLNSRWQPRWRPELKQRHIFSSTRLKTKIFLFSTGSRNLEPKNTLVQFSSLPGTSFYIFKMAAKIAVKTKIWAILNSLFS